MITHFKTKLFFGFVLLCAILTIALTHSNFNPAKESRIFAQRHAYANFLVACGTNLRDANDPQYQNSHGYYSHMYGPYATDSVHSADYELSIHDDTLWILDGDRLLGSCRYPGDSQVFILIAGDNP